MNASNRIALVTGAGTGIGKRTSLALWEAGYSVVLAGRRVEPLEQTVAESGVSADHALVVPTDVSDPASVQNLFAKTKEKYGRLDVLFNNAGMGAPSVSIEEVEMEHWQAVFNINVTGTFLCTQEAFRIMKSQNPRGGRIINNGSLSAHAPRLHSSAYTASKHAITGLTRAANLDGRQYDIAVGQIDIGNAETEMTSRMSAGVKQANGTVIPEPTMNADNVAQAVVYMAGLPLNTNVLFITVMATQMPYVGRG
jgi:NAD(P)-dependent dehydrogenase (short-subunit alcohol dehydrogenase family)